MELMENPPAAVPLRSLLDDGPPDDIADDDRKLWDAIVAHVDAATALNEGDAVYCLKQAFESITDRPLASDDSVFVCEKLEGAPSIDIGFWRKRAVPLVVERFWRAATTFGQLFRPLDRWGLRGDPHLFSTLAAITAELPLPETEVDVRAQVSHHFLEQTGQPLHVEPMTEENASFFVEAFAHGGMSSGSISRRLWANIEDIVVLRWAHARGVPSFSCAVSDEELHELIGYVPNSAAGGLCTIM